MKRYRKVRGKLYQLMCGQGGDHRFTETIVVGPRSIRVREQCQVCGLAMSTPLRFVASSSSSDGRRP